MPRELFHWHIVDRTLASDALPPRCRAILERYRDVAYLGSFAHDVPYYYKAGTDSFENVADFMHGREGEDTFIAMRLLAREILKLDREKRDAGWALLLGMLSHLAGDAVFHPLIFYVTGNYHDPDPSERPRAQARHRLFEVYLESWIRPKVRFSHGERISRLIRSIGPSTMDILVSVLDRSLLSEHIDPTGKVVEGERWRSGFSQLSFYQALFISQPFGALFRGLTRVTRGRFDGIDALFTYGRAYPAAALDGILEYRNPVTGEETRGSLDELTERSVSLLLELIATVEPFAAGSESDAQRLFYNRFGPSLNFGLPKARADEAKYFSTTGFPLPGLRRGGHD